MTRRLGYWLLALVLIVAWAPPAAAQQIIAFGDSMVEGFGDEDEEGGWPRRLRKILRKTDDTANVLNFGLGGETTSEGVTRIDTAIAEGGDIIIVMEGTNDVDDLLALQISLPTVISNLDQMTRKIKNANIEAVLSTIIWRPPTAAADKQSMVTRAVAGEIREIAFSRQTRLLDAYRAFDPDFVQDPFRNYYFKGFDPVGHLNAAGYQRFAEVSGDVFEGVDNVSPVLGNFSPGLAASVIPKDIEIRIPIYEPQTSSGLNRRSTRLLINRKEVGTVQGNARKLEIVHQGSKELGCRAVLQLQAADRAPEPNVYDRVIGVYDIEGETVPNGDVDFDCRVDGFDLISMSQRFGARRGDPLYNSFFDLNFDGVIDEEDIDIVRGAFGRTS